MRAENGFGRLRDKLRDGLSQVVELAGAPASLEWIMEKGRR